MAAVSSTCLWWRRASSASSCLMPLTSRSRRIARPPMTWPLASMMRSASVVTVMAKLMPRARNASTECSMSPAASASSQEAKSSTPAVVAVINAASPMISGSSPVAGHATRICGSDRSSAQACALCCGRAPKPSTAIRIASGIPACPIAAFAGVERLPARGSRGGVPRSAERPANQSTLPPRRIATEVGQIVNMPAVENAQEERISCGRWALSLRPPCEFEPFIQGGVTAHRRGHQEAVALGEDALHVVDINVRVADDNVVPLTGLDDPRHPLEHLGMLVLPRVSELLGEVALADEDGADAGHLLQDLR